jgi:hypothetical protein
LKSSTTIQREINNEISNLPVYYQKKFLDMLKLIKQGIKTLPSSKHSITELKGCGKGIWKNIDAQTYINKLRGEWD